MRDLATAARECPVSPPGHASVPARTLHRACVIVGGAGALAERLGVALADVERWLTGEEAVPENVFLDAVEVVLLHAEGFGRSS